VTVCLDSWAIIAWLDGDEPAFSRLEAQVREAMVASWINVARLKAAHPMALADCFAVATAASHGVPLLTGDPEIIGTADLPCAVEDLRAT